MRDMLSNIALCMRKFKRVKPDGPPEAEGLNIYIYMGGLALMVISPKKWEFSTYFMSTLGNIQSHLKSLSDFI